MAPCHGQGSLFVPARGVPSFVMWPACLSLTAHRPARHHLTRNKNAFDPTPKSALFLGSRAHLGGYAVRVYSVRNTSVHGMFQSPYAGQARCATRNTLSMIPFGIMDTLGIEPRASRMLSGCDTTTPCARVGYMQPQLQAV